MAKLGKDEGASPGPWTIEPGTAVSPDGFDEIIGIFHERNNPIYVNRDELPDLIATLMLFLDIEKIEAK